MKIITGPGRSGTSFVAQIIESIAGLGGDYMWEEEVRAGMETKEIVDINKSLFYINGKDQPYSNLWLNKAEIAKATYVLGSVMIKLSQDYHDHWVKDPLFSKTLQVWLDVHASIQMVVICTRQPTKSMESAKRVNRGFEPANDYADWQIEAEMSARQGYLWDTILRYGIPHMVVRYEHMLEDLPRVLTHLFPENDAAKLQQLVIDNWKPNA